MLIFWQRIKMTQAQQQQCDIMKFEIVCYILAFALTTIQSISILTNSPTFIRSQGFISTYNRVLHLKLTNFLISESIKKILSLASSV